MRTLSLSLATRQIVYIPHNVTDSDFRNCPSIGFADVEESSSLPFDFLSFTLLFIFIHGFHPIEFNTIHKKWSSWSTINGLVTRSQLLTGIHILYPMHVIFNRHKLCINVLCCITVEDVWN
jgi:hypothetical protein